MKRFFLAALLLLAGCTNPTDNQMRGEPCTYDLDCGDTLLCAEFECVPSCQLEGDCDPGYACEGSICVPTCESQTDCVRGNCSARDNGEEGRACHVGYLPSCAKGCADAEVCEFGQCAPICETDADCAPGLTCRPSNATTGNVCLVGDPREDDRPGPPAIPPPTDCRETESPGDFCTRTYGNLSLCAHNGECWSPEPNNFVFVLRDETRFEDCSEQTNGLEAPGADIRQIELLEDHFVPQTLAQGKSLRFHPIPSPNDFSDPRSLASDAVGERLTCEDVRESDFLSLTCGGSLVFGFFSYDGRPFYTHDDWSIWVREIDQYCGLGDDDTYSLGICLETHAVLNGTYEDDCHFVPPENDRFELRPLFDAIVASE